MTMDSNTRFHHFVRSFPNIILNNTRLCDAPGFNSTLQIYIEAQAILPEKIWNDNRTFYMSYGDVILLLGKAVRCMHTFTRTMMGCRFCIWRRSKLLPCSACSLKVTIRIKLHMRIFSSNRKRILKPQLWPYSRAPFVVPFGTAPSSFPCWR